MRSKSPEMKSKILHYVKSYQNKHGDFPTLRKIGDAVGLTHVAVLKYLREMDEENVLKYDPRAKSRAKEPILSEPRIPLLGDIPCGEASPKEGDVLDYIEIPSSWGKSDDLFFLEASGDSMTGANIYSGDLLLLRKTDEAREGQIVAALVDHHESTLKTLMMDESGRYYLHPENERYADIYPEELEIQAVLVRLIRNFE